MQAEVNIGLVGHVDHGKTSLTKALTGKWTDTHSEELKRGISIKIGYADASFYKCPKCERHSTKEQCPYCREKTKFLRKVSFLDAPGHETLMTTTIAASSIIEGGILVIAANEQCPQPQTLEHLMILDILGIKNLVVVQNKIDLVTEEKAKESYKQIKAFLKGTVGENAPIIPMAANYGTNVDALIGAIEETIKTPKRDEAAPMKMYVARSFDVNKPGTQISKLRGGVIGGSIVQGTVKVGDEIEIRPGISKPSKDKEVVDSIIVKVRMLSVEGKECEKASPGGLVGIETPLDPSITKADSLVGNIVGKPGTLPPVSSEIEIEYSPIKRADIEIPPPKAPEPVVVSIGTATVVGIITNKKGKKISVKLKHPTCADKSAKIAVSRKVGQRWRLCGYGVLVGGLSK
jgi:translation initiation factor 2 subunit 3